MKAFFAFLLLALTVFASATSVFQTGTGTIASATSGTVTLGSTPNASDSEIMEVGIVAGGSVVASITQTGVLWSRQNPTYAHNASSAVSEIWVGQNIGVGASKTITVTLSASGIANMAMIEYTGVGGTLFLDQSKTGVYASTATATVTSSTTSATNFASEVSVVGFAHVTTAAGTFSSPTNSYTIEAQANQTTLAVGIADNTLSSSGATTSCGVTDSVTGQYYATSVATFYVVTGQTLLQDFNLWNTAALSSVSAGSVLTQGAIDQAGNVWVTTAGHTTFASNPPSGGSPWLTGQLYFGGIAHTYTSGTIVATINPGASGIHCVGIMYNPSTEAYYMAYVNLNTMNVAIYKLSGGVTTTLITSSTITYAAHAFQVVFNWTSASLLTCNVYDMTLNPGDPQNIAYPNPVLSTSITDTSLGGSGGFCLTEGAASSQFTRVRMYGIPLSISPSYLLNSTASTTTTITPVGTTEGAGTTWSVSGVSGTSITSQTWNAGSGTFTIVFATGATTGTATLSNSTDTNVLQIPVQVPAVLAAGAISQTACTSSTLAFAMVSPTGGRPPYTYQWYRLATAETTPGGTGSTTLSDGSGVSGSATLTLTDASTGLAPGTTYYYACAVTDTTSTTTYSLAGAAVLAGPTLIIGYGPGNSITWGNWGTAPSGPRISDACTLYLSTIYGPRGVVGFNEGHNGAATADFLSTANGMGNTTGSVTSSVTPSLANFGVSIVASMNGDQLSGATITFTSGAQNGNSATVSYYDFVAGVAYFTTPLTGTAPSSGDTFNVTNTKNYRDNYVSAANYWHANVACMMLGTNDTHSPYSYSVATHVANMQNICAYLKAQIPTLQFIVIQQDPYFLAGNTSGVYTNQSVDLIVQYAASNNQIPGPTAGVVLGEQTLLNTFMVNQSTMLLSNQPHPTASGVTAIGVAWALGIIKGTGILPGFIFRIVGG